MSHGGVALYDSGTGRLVQWLMMSSGTPTSAHLEGDEVAVDFADGRRCRYDATNGRFTRARCWDPNDAGRAPEPGCPRALHEGGDGEQDQHGRQEIQGGPRLASVTASGPRSPDGRSRQATIPEHRSVELRDQRHADPDDAHRDDCEYHRDGHGRHLVLRRSPARRTASGECWSVSIAQPPFDVSAERMLSGPELLLGAPSAETNRSARCHLRRLV